MIFLKSCKTVAMAHAVLPLLGCAAGLGMLFNGFVRGLAYAPDLEDTLFSYAMLGFALIESFMVACLIIVGVIYAL